MEDMLYIVNGPPRSKPRMTQQDKWLEPVRPPVAKYREYKARIQAVVPGCARKDWGEFPCRVDLVFYMAHKTLRGFHKLTRRNDIDNMAKAVLDSMFEDDAGVCWLTARKVLCDPSETRTEITLTKL